jgi:hypothetical protein
LPNFLRDLLGVLIREPNRLRMRVHYKPGDDRRHGDQSSFFLYPPIYSLAGFTFQGFY